MNRRLFVAAGVALVLGIGVWSGLATKTYGPIIQVSMAISVVAALLNMLAVPFFLGGVRQFKAELQRAYLILCIGIGIFGFAQIQLPFITLFDWWGWINSGGIAVPYLVGVVCMLWGMRVFAALLRVKRFGTSPFAAFGLSVVLSLAAVLVPHVKIATDELTFHLSLAISIFDSVFVSFAAVIAFQIRRIIGATYIRSMSWLCAALVVVSVAGWQYVAVQLTLHTGDWYYDYTVMVAPFILGGLLLVAAGYAFSNINVWSGGRASQRSALELDVVMYVAGLVSNPSEINLALEDVRRVTSHMTFGQALSDEGRAVMVGVYAKIELYLVENDPLRTFSREELRHRIAKEFELGDQPSLPLWA